MSIKFISFKFLINGLSLVKKNARNVHIIYKFYLMFVSKKEKRKALLDFRKRSQDQNNILIKIKDKNVINVVFIVIFESVWKYEHLYSLFNKDSRYNPIVVIAPFTVYTPSEQVEYALKVYNFFQSRGYNTICSYDKKIETWIDVKTFLNIDIVFFTAPYSYTSNDYTIQGFSNSLTCYVPYFFVMNILYKNNYDTPFQNMLWRAFYETNIHLSDAKKYSSIKAKNVVITGYPGLDSFLNKSNIKNNFSRKKLIIAPHHTIESKGAGLNYSNFLKYSDFFKQLTFKYLDDIDFIFKPHPLLKTRLYSNPEWGEKRANEYYAFWNNISNRKLHESFYADLFLDSDAMIHDCGSFTVEYIMVNKPVLYLIHDSDSLKRVNYFGKKAISCHYHAYSENDIINFINNVVIAGLDTMVETRNFFRNKYLIQAKGQSASKNIYDYINKQIY
jgi:hypothetical protein